MSLLKTVTYPEQPLYVISDVLDELILKMVIIGPYPEFVHKADQLAQDPPIIDRKVIWLKSFPEELSNQFIDLPEDTAQIVGFSCSTINKVSKVIFTGEPLDYAILLSAYADAGLPPNN